MKHRTTASPAAKPGSNTVSLALRRQTVAIAVSTAFAWPYAVYALPTGGQVAAGSATISQPNAQSMLVTQGTQKLILNWL